MKELPTILALDPGGTTGYCLWLPDQDRVVQGQLVLPNHHKELYAICARGRKTTKGSFVIVCERFEFRRDERHRDKIDYVAREYIGVVKLFVQMTLGATLFEQGASQAKQFFSDDVLKKLSVWVPGQRHAMDATRHYLYHRVFTHGDSSLLQKLK